jgi:twinkle protein
MSDITHQPCPYEDCGSSDAFSYSTNKKVGMCYSCGKAYPSNKMKLLSWADEAYPLKNAYVKPEGDDMANVVKIKSDNTDYTQSFKAQRGISAKTMEFYNVPTFTDSDGNAVKHTYHYPNGTSKTRGLPKDFNLPENRGFKPDMLFGMNLFPAGCSIAITITEGELDAMSAYQMLNSKYPVVSLPSATPSRKLLENCKDWLGSFDKIILSLDSDDKAEKFALALINLFPKKVYKVPHGSYKDANEFLVNGSSDTFRSTWYNSGLYTPDNIYASSEDFLELLHDTPDHAYIPTGIHDLDEKILGLMQGHFTVIKAPTGIGKSEFMRYLEYNFIQNHPTVKFATWHLEETKLRSLLGLVSYHLGDNLTRKDLIDGKDRMSDVERAIREITAKEGYMQFHLREEDGPDELIEQVRVLTQVFGCQFILFEPIQDTVTVSDDKTKEGMLADLSVRLSKLAADLNVGIVTIAHTNEHGDPKYCKMIAQRASVIIDLERDKESDDLIERNTTSLYVRKNRPCGLEGPAGKLIFDGDTFTLQEKGFGW